MQLVSPLHRLNLLCGLGTFLSFCFISHQVNAQVMTEGTRPTVINEAMANNVNAMEECEVLYSSMNIKALGKSNSIMIAWKALASSEHDMFQLERSYDGENFSMVTTIPYRKPKEGQEFGSYTVVDGSPEFDKNGAVYYRVVSAENDGSLTYSEVKSLELPSYSLAASTD